MKLLSAIVGIVVLLVPELVFSSALATSVGGFAQVSTGSAAPRNLRQGDTVGQGDTVNTGAESFVVLRFDDGQVAVLPANSSMKVTTYNYDPKERSGSIQLSLISGGMRTITGLIGRMAPQNVVYSAATATINIRGTDTTVLTYKKNVVVTVEDGIVSLTIAGQTNTIRAGEGVIASSDGSIRVATVARIIHQLAQTPQDQHLLDMIGELQGVSLAISQAASGVSSGMSPGGVPPDFDKHALFKAIRVFYATNRVRTEDSDPNAFYGSGVFADTQYGICYVTIPSSHERGKLERPFDLWIISLPESRAKHISLHRVIPTSKNAFFAQLANAIDAKPTRSAFVFVHGFNTSFAEAARRAAQIANDIDLDLVPIIYSWPSESANPPNLIHYTSDWTRVEVSYPNVQKFLVELSARTGANTIHLIAHSMGSQAISHALKGLVESGTKITRFRHVVLGAPDIDAKVFNDQIAPAFVGGSVRFSVYASSTDTALRVSSRVHATLPRLGQITKDMTIPTFMDLIDATVLDESVLGHAYLFESRALLTDLFYLLGEDKRASSRYGLKREPEGYYRFSR
jgi:esterase/lipase superfamily enzyme